MTHTMQLDDSEHFERFVHLFKLKKDAARLLGLVSAQVSQYLHGDRRILADAKEKMRNAGWDFERAVLVVKVEQGETAETKAQELGLRRNAEYVHYVDEVRRAGEQLPPLQQYEGVKEKVHFHTSSYPKDGTLIRVFSSPASAGNGKLLYDDVEKYINISKKYHPNTFLISIEGDSLKNIGITEHHRLLIDPTIEPKNNMFVLAKINDNFVVKRYKTNGQTFLLCPENPDYQPIPCTIETEIVGVVVECVLPLLP